MVDDNMAASADEETQVDAVATDDNAVNGDAEDNGASDNEVTAEAPNEPTAAAEDAPTAPSETGPARNGSYRSSYGDVLGGPAPVGDPTVPRKDVPNGRAYEIIYIVRAGDPEAVEQTSKRVRDLIEGSGGAVDNLRTSEARRTAYLIHKQIEGVYTVVNARFAKETSNELDRFFKLEENVLRHMILKEDN